MVKGVRSGRPSALQRSLHIFRRRWQLHAFMLIPLIYIMPRILNGSSAMMTRAVYMAEPIADTIAVTFTAILFYIQFRKVIAKI